MTAESLRLAYVTHYDASSLASYSGTAAHMLRALQRAGAHVTPVGSLPATFSLGARTRTRLARLLGRRHRTEREPSLLAAYARAAEDQLARASVDAVVTPTTIPVSHLGGKLPVFVWTDATFPALLGEYDSYTGLTLCSELQGMVQERRAFDRCRLAVFSNDWAAASALRDCHVPAEKVRVVPYGANLDGPLEPPEIEAFITARSVRQCVLTFVGVEWYRKGGDRAVAVAEHLNASGLPTVLNVVGAQPPPVEANQPFVRVSGFLEKRTAEGQRRFQHLLAASHFLILPARAECAAMVLAEANSVGVPCLVTRVGGIPTVVNHAINGLVFEPDAPAEELAQAVRGWVLDGERYRRLARSSLNEYSVRLNWDTAALTFLDLLRRHL